MRLSRSVPRLNDLPLHDAILESIVLSRSSRELEIFLAAFMEPGQLAEQCSLQFRGVSNLEAPQKSPWGESNSINSAREVSGGFELEMQSGDILKIEATEFRFEKKTS